jgi:hypothetical protein
MALIVRPRAFGEREQDVRFRHYRHQQANFVPSCQAKRQIERGSIVAKKMTGLGQLNPIRGQGRPPASDKAAVPFPICFGKK